LSDTEFGITRQGTEAEARFATVTGARASRTRSRGDCVLERHFVEIKKVGAEGQINQIRPAKYIPLVVWDQVRAEWYVIPPQVLVQHAVDRRRGQHSENPFECVALPLRRFRGYRVSEGNLRDATLGTVALAACYEHVAAAMSGVLHETRELALRHRVAVRAALDADEVVDLRGSMLLPW
jgi:hypothetical protein